jgi:hypothetical protein
MRNVFLDNVEHGGYLHNIQVCIYVHFKFPIIVVQVSCTHILCLLYYNVEFRLYYIVTNV